MYSPSGPSPYSFVSASDASSLAYVNDAGNAIMKVDNTSTVAFNDKRNTVRISSKDEFSSGSVWVADMLHFPFGVGYSIFLIRSRGQDTDELSYSVPYGLHSGHKRQIGLQVERSTRLRV